MRFGASSWPFQWEPPYEDCIRRVAGCGFKAIELIAWNTDFLDNYWTKSKIGDIKKELKNSGIGLSQFVHTPHDLSHARQGQARRRRSSTGRRRSQSAPSSARRSSTW